MRVSGPIATLLGTAALGLGSPAGAQPATYADVAPILVERCAICHRGDAAPLGLRLDSLASLEAGSRNGPVVKAGDPDGSELIRRIKGLSQPRMPMTGPPFLGEAEIALFERWVAQGLEPGPAPASSAQAPAPAPSRPAPGDPVTYAHVAPIFATRCAKCHTERGLMGPAPEGLRLTSYEATLAARDRARVVPGRPEASELVRRIRGQARPRMPFDGPPYLDEAETALIVEWIRQGARDSEAAPARIPRGADVRLHGTLGDGWRLDDLPLELTDDVEIDDMPRPGDYVEVRGHLHHDGSVSVERIRPR